MKGERMATKAAKTTKKAAAPKLDRTKPSGMKAPVVATPVETNTPKKRAKIVAGTPDSGSGTFVAARGLGTGGHEGTLRLLGVALDDTFKLTWDGDTVETTVEKDGYTSGILTTGGIEYRFEVTSPE